jgi:hypothetical protein
MANGLRNARHERGIATRYAVKAKARATLKTRTTKGLRANNPGAMPLVELLNDSERKLLISLRNMANSDTEQARK